MTFRGWVIAGGVIAGAMGLFFVSSIVVEAVKGEVREAFGLVGVTAFFLGLAVASAKLGAEGLKPHMRFDRGGTTFRPDRLVDIPLGIAYLGLVLNIVNAIARPHEGWPPWLSVGLRLAEALTAIVICVLMLVYVRWRASSYLRLTPGGVEMGEGLRARSCGWDQIGHVGDAAPGERLKAVVLAVAEAPALRVTTSTYLRNGTALRDLVDFYWRHPEARGELTDGSVPRRIAASLSGSH